MITSARIDALRELNDDPDTATDFGWITALRAPAIAKLARDDGPLQMSLFDTQDLAEIAHPDYPGERLIACRNPALAAERARKRARPAGRDRQAARRASPTGSPAAPWPAPARSATRSARSSTNTRWASTSTPPSPTPRFTYHRDQARIDAEAALDGIYVLRTSVDRRGPRPRRGRRGLQEPRQRRTRLPHHQDRRPGPAAHPPPPRRPRQSPRADLPARLLPDLAPAQGLGANDIHRRTPTPTGQPGRPRAALRRRRRQSRPQARRRRQPAAQLPRPARPPGHPHPQPDPLPPTPTPRCPCSPTPPPTNAAPSTSSTPRSHSPPPRSQNNHPAKPANPQVNPGIHPFS